MRLKDFPIIFVMEDSSGEWHLYKAVKIKELCITKNRKQAKKAAINILKLFL